MLIGVRTEHGIMISPSNVFGQKQESKKNSALNTIPFEIKSLDQKHQKLVSYIENPNRYLYKDNLETLKQCFEILRTSHQANVL